VSVRLASSLLAVVAVLAACSPPAPPPASVTVKEMGQQEAVRMNHVRVDGILDAGEWDRADSAHVLLPDGRDILVLRQRGPDTLDFAFLGLGGNWSRNIQPELLIDVSGLFPPHFSRDSWWIRLGATLCIKRAEVDGECDPQLFGVEKSSPPIDRRDPLEVSITLSMLEFSPLLVPEVALAYRFAENPLLVEAIWPTMADLRRPDTWARVDVSN